MAIAIHQISPVAHLPLVLGGVRKLNIATLIDTFCPPHPAHVLSCGRGVEALLLAILDGHHGVPDVCAGKFTMGLLSPRDDVKRQSVEIPAQVVLTANDATRYCLY